MVATVNLPGSSHFAYFVGTKKECEEWLDLTAEEYKNRFQGTWFNAFSPAQIISNKEAAKWKYRDGSKVIDF